MLWAHKGLHQGWTQTSLYLQVIHFTSHHTTSNGFVLVYLHSAGTQHGNLHPSGWPLLICGPTQAPCVSHSQHRKMRERFWENAGEWTWTQSKTSHLWPWTLRQISVWNLVRDLSPLIVVTSTEECISPRQRTLTYHRGHFGGQEYGTQSENSYLSP